jgi:hypothetical protein
LLRILLQHLKNVTKQSDKNKMDAFNLGIVWGPSLLRVWVFGVFLASLFLRKFWLKFGST